MEDESTPWSLSDVQSQVPRSSLIALKSGEIYSVALYRVAGGSLSYELTTGEKGSIDLPEVDWRETSRLRAGVGPR